MRIIGRLPDPRMQITVFENDGRFPVQFELGGITQIYRFRKGERLSNMGHLRTYVDENFRAAVLRQFQEMQRIQADVLQRISPPADETDSLPNII
ncbi:hypothetical protein GGR26_003372 [Lewinella marina]|uniref:Uncharacterized protein n=1 Tax=Neolewinella marina TaxID=438751 RepID=A0A2G0CCM2_9BACT|nr:hypothetical protein [Neolewinella marina]NJB87588.1 hypothetical protein [Neolewinella marina]PHK97721.1 hypothetical protein CGL56_14950 [Neolewinella marina]